MERPLPECPDGMSYEVWNGLDDITDGVKTVWAGLECLAGALAKGELSDDEVPARLAYLLARGLGEQVEALENLIGYKVGL